MFPNWMCRGREFIAFLNYYASMFFLMIMSIDRYVAVCQPFSAKLQKLRTIRAGSVISIIVWLICCILCINFMQFMVVRGVEPHCKCQFSYGSGLLDDKCKGDLTQLSILDQEECFLLNALHQDGSQCLSSDMIGHAASTFDDYNSTGYIDDQHNMDSASFYEYEDTTNDPVFEESGPDDLLMKELLNLLSMADELNSTSYNEGDDGFDMTYFGFDNQDDTMTAILSPHNSDAGGETEIIASPAIPPACYYKDAPDVWKQWVYLNFFLFFLLPIVVMFTCYGLIIVRLSAMKGTEEATKKRHQRITWMCSALVANVLLCWLLWHASHLAKINGISPPNNDGKFCVAISDAANVLAFLSAAINPYLYSFIGTKFFRRWRDATASFTRSLGSMAGSSHDNGIVVRYNNRHKGNNNKSVSSDKNVTTATKLSGGQSSTTSTVAPPLPPDTEYPEIPQIDHSASQIVITVHPDTSEHVEPPRSPDSPVVV